MQTRRGTFITRKVDKHACILRMRLVMDGRGLLSLSRDHPLSFGDNTMSTHFVVLLVQNRLIQHIHVYTTILVTFFPTRQAPNFKNPPTNASTASTASSVFFKNGELWLPIISRTAQFNPVACIMASWPNFGIAWSSVHTK